VSFLIDSGLIIIKETSGYATWFTAGGAIRIAHYDVIDDVITRKLEKNGDHIAPSNRLNYPMVKTASLYDNFCKTGNYVIYDVIISVQDGNCKKYSRGNFSIGAFYNITKNQDNPIKTVRQDIAPKPLKIQVF